jgi:hypothetical protein
MQTILKSPMQSGAAFERAWEAEYFFYMSGDMELSTDRFVVDALGRFVVLNACTVVVPSRSKATPCGEGMEGFKINLAPGNKCPGQVGENVDSCRSTAKRSMADPTLSPTLSPTLLPTAYPAQHFPFSSHQPTATPSQRPASASNWPNQAPSYVSKVSPTTFPTTASSAVQSLRPSQHLATIAKVYDDLNSEVMLTRGHLPWWSRLISPEMVACLYGLLLAGLVMCLIRSWRRMRPWPTVDDLFEQGEKDWKSDHIERITEKDRHEFRPGDVITNVNKIEKKPLEAGPVELPTPAKNCISRHVRSKGMYTVSPEMLYYEQVDEYVKPWSGNRETSGAVLSPSQKRPSYVACIVG